MPTCWPGERSSPSFLTQEVRLISAPTRQFVAGARPFAASAAQTPSTSSDASGSRKPKFPGPHAAPDFPVLSLIIVPISLGAVRSRPAGAQKNSGVISQIRLSDPATAVAATSMSVTTVVSPSSVWRTSQNGVRTVRGAIVTSTYRAMVGSSVQNGERGDVSLAGTLV